MSEYKCEICGKVCRNPQALKMHLRTHEKKENPTLPPNEKESDVKATMEKDIPEKPTVEQPMPTDKEGKKEPTSIPNLSLLAPILRSFGITDGASLIKAIDDKARQMPFYNEIVNEMNQTKRQVEELNGIITETSQKIDALISQLQQAQAQAQAQANTDDGSSPEAKGQPQIQPVQSAAGGAGSLERWADRLLQLLQVGASSGNSSPPPPEEKYKDLITFANVLKTIQGDPMKQLTESFKVFTDMQKNAISIAKTLPATPSARNETPPRQTKNLEE